MSKRLVPFAIYALLELILGIYAVILDGRNSADWESLTDLCQFVVVICIMVILGGIAIIHAIIQLAVWGRERKVQKLLKKRELMRQQQQTANENIHK